MQRREEGLGYWLVASPPPEQLTLWVRVRRAFLRHRQAGKLRPATCELPLEMGVDVFSSEEFIPTSRPVCDGLGHLASPDSFKGWKENRCQVAVAEMKIHALEPLPEPAANKGALLEDLLIRVNRQEWIHLPVAKASLQDALGKKTRVRSVTCLHELGHARSCSQWLSPVRIGVRTGTRGISALPHTGWTLDLNEIRESERESFLQEATALKGVAPGRGELLAIFRNVPIEVVSRLRFVRETGTIHYNLTFNPSLRRTRVHDLAAVRDAATDEIHLVAHRTRYRTVFLN